MPQFETRPVEGVDYHYVNGVYTQGPTPGSTAERPAPGTTTGYNLAPTPTSGRGAFGAIPGQMGLPDPAADLAGEIPGLRNLNAEASGNILSQLRGELSPDTIRTIQDASAQWGVGSGMPGSGLQINRGLRDIGLNSEAVQQAGQKNLSALTSSVSNTQTVSPELQAGIASENAANAAAPDPTVAANYSQALFDQYMKQMNPNVVRESTRFDNGISSTVRSVYDPLTGKTSTRRI